MGNSYNSVENKIDKAIKKKREQEDIKLLRQLIMDLVKEPFENGLTQEQIFLIEYYGLQGEIPKMPFSISNTRPIQYKQSSMPVEELEEKRYNALIDLYSEIADRDIEKIKQLNDRFHKEVIYWDDYTKDFKNDTLLVKKMRNLQLLNRMAHAYEVLWKKFLYSESPEIDENYTEKNKRRMEKNVKEMFSKVEEDSQMATRTIDKTIRKSTSR